MPSSILLRAPLYLSRAAHRALRSAYIYTYIKETPYRFASASAGYHVARNAELIGAVKASASAGKSAGAFSTTREDGTGADARSQCFIGIGARAEFFLFIYTSARARRASSLYAPLWDLFPFGACESARVITRYTRIICIMRCVRCEAEDGEGLYGYISLWIFQAFVFLGLCSYPGEDDSTIISGWLI